MRTIVTKTWLIASVLWLATAGTAAGRITYVDTDANGNNDGSSWADAYNHLQDALAEANSNPDVNEIRVAQGIYEPDQGTGITPGYREATFRLVNAVTIEGGYAGCGEPDPNARAIRLYETILSGDLAGNDIAVNDPCDLLSEPTRAENSYHVVSASHIDANTALDGVTITGGMATRQSDPYDLAARGGGMCCGDQASPTVSRCTFRANAARWGGGMYVFMSRSSPKLVNCRFVGNAADRHAGGLRIDDSHMSRVTNCTFSRNWARWNGGAVCNFDTHPVYVNCIFSANAAGGDGGAMWNVDSSWYTLVNCTLIGNTAGHRGGAIDSDEWPTLTNCILWASRDSTGMGESAHVRGHYREPDFDYCCVQGWTGSWGGAGNIGSDPCFVDPGYWDSNGTPGDVNDDFWVDGDYHLLPGSPCIDAGDPNYVPEPNETDLDCNPRVIDGRIDMGAYEFVPAIECQVVFLPRVINRHSRGKRIIGLMFLPEGITKNQLSSEKFVLHPGVIEAEHQMVLPRSPRQSRRAMVICFFERDALLAAVPDDGRAQLRLSGSLNDGRRCCGSGTVWMRSSARLERFWRPWQQRPR